MLRARLANFIRRVRPHPAAIARRERCRVEAAAKRRQDAADRVMFLSKAAKLRAEIEGRR